MDLNLILIWANFLIILKVLILKLNILTSFPSLNKINKIIFPYLGE